MAHAIDIKHLDRRTAARYLERGIISQADWDKHLNQLPDLAEKAEVIAVDPPDAPKGELAEADSEED